MAEIRFPNQYRMTGGFNISSGEPIDSRMYVADIAHILLDSNWAVVKPYPGLIVSAPDGQVRVFAPQTGQTYKDADAWLEIGGGAAIVVEKYDDALTAATSKNIGTIVYVTNNPETGATNTGSKYNGAYVVSGANSLSKLGTTTVGEDIAGEVTALQGKVGSLEVTVNGNDENEGLVKKVADLRTDLKTLDGEAVKGIKMRGESEEVLSPADGIVTLSWDTNVQENSSLPATSGAVYSHVESKIETAKLTIDDKSTTDGALKSYKFMQGTTEVGTIDIPKDLVVKSGSVIVATEEDVEIDSSVELGETYIKLIVNATSEEVGGDTLYIAAKSLVDSYTSGDDYISVDNSANTIALNISEVASYVDDELGKLVADIKGSLSTLVKKNKNAIATLNGALNTPGSVANRTFEGVERLIDGSAELNGSKSSLYQVAQNANSALQEIKSGNENQLTVSPDENDSTIITLTPVVAVLDDLENGTNPEKLLTAGVAKEYIDNKWDWEVIA